MLSDELNKTVKIKDCSVLNKVHSRVAANLKVKSSHLYLYSAFNNTNCNKALHNIKIGKLCQ